jgi:hypothetical protein
MNQTVVRVMAVVAAIAIASSTFATATVQSQAPAKIDVTGGWTFTVQTEMGTGTPQVTFKQDGEKLTGHYSSSVLGDAELAGSVKGQAIQFSFTASVQGNAIEVTFTGTIEDTSSMKGKVSFGGIGDGTFTGQRK